MEAIVWCSPLSGNEKADQEMDQLCQGIKNTVEQALSGGHVHAPRLEYLPSREEGKADPFLLDKIRTRQISLMVVAFVAGESLGDGEIIEAARENKVPLLVICQEGTELPAEFQQDSVFFLLGDFNDFFLVISEVQRLLKEGGKK